MKLSVYLNMYGKRSLVGLLQEIDGTIYFEYARDFLQSGIELSPFRLPLNPGIFHDEKKTFDGLFGLFNDSLPDGWGCLLLDRRLRKSGLAYDSISPIMRLSMIGASPMGALEYEPADCAAETFGAVELDSLSREVDKILDGNDSVDLDELVSLNGSSGGARPKIVAWVSGDRTEIVQGRGDLPGDFSQWIIKFLQRGDPENLGELEYRYSLAAKDAGIEMPPTYLFPSKTGGGYFGVQRFDRTSGGKVHVHTACGLLHASHRYSCLDYENLLKLTLALTRDAGQVEEMVRRMIFNVKGGNRDDHSKNFSFLLAPDLKWRLAPAYDLTPSGGINGEQTAMVNGKGRDIGDDDLICASQVVDVPEKRVRDMIAAVEDSLSLHGL